MVHLGRSYVTIVVLLKSWLQVSSNANTKIAINFASQYICVEHFDLKLFNRAGIIRTNRPRRPDELLAIFLVTNTHS